MIGNTHDDLTADTLGVQIEPGTPAEQHAAAVQIANIGIRLDAPVADIREVLEALGLVPR